MACVVDLYVTVSLRMAQEALKKLEEQLNCGPICLDRYLLWPQATSMPPCLLQKCLVKLVIRDQQGVLSLTCPSLSSDHTCSTQRSGRPSGSIPHQLPPGDSRFSFSSEAKSSTSYCGRGSTWGVMPVASILCGEL